MNSSVIATVVRRQRAGVFRAHDTAAIEELARALMEKTIFRNLHTNGCVARWRWRMNAHTRLYTVCVCVRTSNGAGHHLCILNARASRTRAACLRGAGGWLVECGFGVCTRPEPLNQSHGLMRVRLPMSVLQEYIYG